MTRYIPKNDIHSPNFMRDSKAIASDFDDDKPNTLSYIALIVFFCVLAIILFI